MLDPGLIAAVAAVVREGSFERAARALAVTPSAVSQRVKLIEERLGTVLIVRGAPCTATETGARLCRHAELVGMLEADLRRDLPRLATEAAPDAGRPTLRVAVNADSLGTWFIQALAEFGRHESALLDIAIDDQDHTADWLLRGHVLAAVTSLAAPVQGCRSRKLGTLRYVATASPAFVRRWFAQGLDATSLAHAPSLLFNRKDRLQAQWVKRIVKARRELDLPTHWLPATQAFVDAALAGVGWGMNPLPLVQPHLAAGRLVELVPGQPLDVPLYWQCARLPVPMLDRLTDSVTRVAARVLG
ncbi:MAG: LysR family transcriptional regulator ArgP [Burkholderiaceae bacterium]|jgi:LysR family transcriptional regulator (chromosome initiation inhibitor)|nr:LysR family transcriptional regulator ArgP [Burkholderiaceae bacterium]